MDNIISQQEKENIDMLCLEYEILNYEIHSDGFISVSGDVLLIEILATEIPIKFRVVTGDFFLSGNDITSLLGAPIAVGGDFDCRFNSISSLEYCPTKVGGDFLCSYNDLTSLEHCPNVVFGSFECIQNQLTSLKYCPSKVGGDFLVSNNKLISLEYSPITISGDFDCQDNELTSLLYCPSIVLGTFTCLENKLNYSFYDIYRKMSNDDRLVLIMYHTYYSVWAPKFDLNALEAIFDDIKDGLK
jgi:hypothetical protein